MRRRQHGGSRSNARTKEKPGGFARSLTLAGALAVALVSGAQACTRVLSNDNGLAVLVGRTMDWPTSTDPVLTVLPRGVKHDGGKLGPDEIIPNNPLRWTSVYGSLVTTRVRDGHGGWDQ
jgi:penicillin V acylase-like amidase (Ntn superfamily)